MAHTRATTRRAIASLLIGVLVVSCAQAVSTPTAPLTPTGPLETSLPTIAPTVIPTPTAQPTATPTPTPVVVIPSPGPDGTIYLNLAATRDATRPGDATSAAGSVNALAVDLYSRLPAGKNLVVSPTSIVMALAMTRPGARGETAAQIDAVTRNVATDANAGWINALDQALSSRTQSFTGADGKAQKVVLRLANSSFAQLGYPFEQAYLVALAERYGSGIRLVDFKAHPGAARQIINGWVKGRTGGRIPHLLAPADVTTATRLVLANALYLEAPWAIPFQPSATKAAKFRRADGSTVTVPTMHDGRILEGLAYAAGTGWRAAELPYVGRQLAMTIIVPDQLSSFETTMTSESLATIVAALKDQPGEIWLPKFSIDTKTQLAAILEAMGMPLAFDPTTADFTGIADPTATGEPPLYIAKVIHQANIDVDEKGTVAAAATAVVMGVGSGPAPKWVRFHVDRPFIFLIRDVPTGAILFIGRVGDPSVH
jgi:serine protease inhibitor